MPKVSCITITRNRVEFLKKAIQYYIAQTHNDKEMVIMYYIDDENTKEYISSLDIEWIKEHDINFYPFIPTEGMMLGAVRNIATKKAKGDYLCIWDDDDYYSPDRIEKQLEYIKEKKLIGCTLRSLVIFSEKHQEIRVSYNRNEGWEGSLMVEKEKMPLYHNLPTAEDTPVLEKLFLTERIKAYDNPNLYVYILHTGNTTTAKHHEGIYDTSYDVNARTNIHFKKLIGWI